MNLNHIFLFLAIVSPLLVLARAWRPGTPYHGWRFAALVILANYRRGLVLLAGRRRIHWRRRMVLPPVSAGDWITENDAARRPKAITNRPRILAQHSRFCIPAVNCASSIRVFRRLGSNPELRRNFSSVPTDHEMPRSARRDQFRNTPAVFILILVNVLVFLFEMSAGDWNDPEVLHRIGALEPYARGRAKANIGGCSPRFFSMAVFCISVSTSLHCIFLVRRSSVRSEQRDSPRVI